LVAPGLIVSLCSLQAVLDACFAGAIRVQHLCR